MNYFENMFYNMPVINILQSTSLKCYDYNNFFQYDKYGSSIKQMKVNMTCF